MFKFKAMITTTDLPDHLFKQFNIDREYSGEQGLIQEILRIICFEDEGTEICKDALRVASGYIIKIDVE